MKKISELSHIDFDGVNRPYVPPKNLNISSELELHQDYDQELNPVTYEVIRHNLWQINEEHGAGRRR